MIKVCEACGKEMGQPTDFAANNPENNYCRHCVDDFDDLKSYEEVFSNQVGFLMEAEEISQEAAEPRVTEQLAKLPAWQSRDG
jgi:ribosome-binding protein aMBF1 (putative translation factor)